MGIVGSFTVGFACWKKVAEGSVASGSCSEKAGKVGRHGEIAFWRVYIWMLSMLSIMLSPWAGSSERMTGILCICVYL
jgi:hypothetical protein